MMIRTYFAFLLVGAASVSVGAMTPEIEARNQRSIYFGSFEVDSYNPVAFQFETLIPNQKIDFKLTTRLLGTAVLSVLGFVDPNACLEAKRRGIRIFGCDSGELIPVSFAQFQVWLEGCNISDQLTQLCNASQCWALDPTVARPTNTGHMGSEFTFAQPVLLNAINASACSAGTFEGFQEDRKYTIEFREKLNEITFVRNAAGKVHYELGISNSSLFLERTKK